MRIIARTLTVIVLIALGLISCGKSATEEAVPTTGPTAIATPTTPAGPAKLAAEITPDPSGQTLMSVKFNTAIENVPEGMSDLWIMYKSTAGNYYTINSSAPLQSGAIRAGDAIDNWPTVAIEGGSDVVFVVATPDTRSIIMQHGTDADGVIFVGHLPVEGINVVKTTAKTLHLDVPPLATAVHQA